MIGRPSMRMPIFTAVCLVALVATACGGRASSRSLVEPEPTATVATADTRSAETFRPEATPVGSALTAELGRTFWAGPIDSFPSALRLRPGPDPDSDLWTADFGDFSLHCEPEPIAGGWRLSACDDVAPNVTFTLEVPRYANGPLTSELIDARGDLPEEVTSTLHRIVPIAEERASNAEVAWHARASESEGNTDIWSADGIVFAPHSNGYVELLSGATGERLSLIDIITAPGTREAEPSALDVKARDGLLYIATGFHGVLIYDVSDPLLPTLIGQYMLEAPDESPDGAWSVHNIFLAPDSDILYVINQTFWSRDLRLVDVSDPSLPIEVGRYEVANPSEEVIFPHDINVVTRDGRQIAYLNYWKAGLRILDTTDPSAIEEIGVWDEPGVQSHAGWPFEQDGRYYYLHGGEGYDQGLTILDVTDLTAPQVVSTYRSRPGISTHNVEVRDGFAYVAYYVDGLRVIDVRDPANPLPVAHYDTVASIQEYKLFQGAWGVRLEGDRVFISDRAAGVFAITVDLPSD